jgi:inner membrane protein
MFIGHLPAGYLCAHYLHPRFAGAAVGRKRFLLAGLIGAIAPDLDLFYFFLVDQRRTPHHLYWPHFPLVWLLLLAVSAGCLILAKRKAVPALALMFSAGGFGHLLLDTIVGDIHWGAPIMYGPFSLFKVEAVYKPWWLNFFLHWSFAFELVLLAWALIVWRRRTG